MTGTKKKNEDLFEQCLPKWAACVVKGQQVTLDQAKEILIRTDSWRLYSNDREWEESVAAAAGYPRLEDTEDFSKYGKLLDDWESSHGIIRLEYLCNSQIITLGAPNSRGWCHWDGTIYKNGANIGKWPEVENVYNDWVRIAGAFPFLKLKCQVFDSECGNFGIQPVVEFVINSGKVEVREPTEAFIVEEENISLLLTSILFNQTRERGCSLELLTEALELTKNNQEEKLKEFANKPTTVLI